MFTRKRSYHLDRVLEAGDYSARPQQFALLRSRIARLCLQVLSCVIQSWESLEVQTYSNLISVDYDCFLKLQLLLQLLHHQHRCRLRNTKLINGHDGYFSAMSSLLISRSVRQLFTSKTSERAHAPAAMN
jgi:hypothetical protein